MSRLICELKSGNDRRMDKPKVGATIIQFSPFRTLWLGTIGMDRVISEPCYTGTILQQNYSKLTILWSFSYNSFVKFCGNGIGEPQHDSILSKSVL